MKNTIKLLSILLVSALSSCGVYTPNAINTPLFTEKGQVALNGILGGEEGELNASYSLTNHLALMVNHQKYYVSQGSSARPPSERLQGPASYNEASIGYFIKMKRGPIFEVFGGYGVGNIDTERKLIQRIENEGVVTENINSFFYKAQKNKIFLQPTIGFAHKNIELAISSRLSTLNYVQTKTNLPDSLKIESHVQYIGSKPFTLLEPALTLKFGTKYVKFQIQLLRSFYLNDAYMNSFGSGLLSIGLTSKFPTRKKKIL